MKVRAGRNVYFTPLTFEEFKLVEFSKDRLRWIPDDQLSCNQCDDEEDAAKDKDSALSFLTKFKADHLGDPKKVRSDGVVGYVLNEGKSYDYRKEPGAPSNFRSVAVNHYNLYANSDELEEFALSVYSDQSKQAQYSAEQVGKYLLNSYERAEWATLLGLNDRKSWKKFVRALLVKRFELRYGPISRADLRKADKLDPADLRANLKILNDYGCLKPKDLEEIRQALGNNALI